MALYSSGAPISFGTDWTAFSILTSYTLDTLLTPWALHSNKAFRPWRSLRTGRARDHVLLHNALDVIFGHALGGAAYECHGESKDDCDGEQ